MKWPMTCFVLLILAMTICGCNKSDLKTEEVIYENDGNICIVDGAGKATTILPSLFKKTAKVYGVDCFDLNTQPYLSYSKEEVVFVKKVNSLKNGGASELDSISKYQVVNYQIKNGRFFVLFEIPDYRFGALVSPIFIDDSSKVVFLYGKKLVLVDSEGKSKPITICEIPNNIDIAKGDYIREGSGGVVYAVFGSSKKKDNLLFDIKDVWEVDLLRKKSKLVQSGALYFGNNGEVKKDEVTGYLSKETCHICFGSAEHPVLEPIESKSGKYYFWDEKREGFMAKRFIGGYDRVNKKLINIYTVWRHIYIE
jgi:hypothetical protein